MKRTICITTVGAGLVISGLLLLTLGPFASEVTEVVFAFVCNGGRCDRTALCCRGEAQRVVILRSE